MKLAVSSGAHVRPDLAGAVAATQPLQIKPGFSPEMASKQQGGSVAGSCQACS